MPRFIFAVLSALAIVAVPADGAPPPSRYQDLVALFREWRVFQKPKVVDGVPDYTAAAMAAQKGALPALQKRLAALDTTGWSISQQIDYHLVRAEMNGLDFDLRVKRPWARSPSFYIMFYPGRSDQPVREGIHIETMIEMFQYPLPQKAAEVDARVKTIPKVLAQAKINLVEDAHDFWVLGIREMKEQSVNLGKAAAGVAQSNHDLSVSFQQAKDATDQFVAWLEQQLPSKKGRSGIGADNYDWYLKNVQLVPYTWADEVALLKAELSRTHGAIKLEEFHDRSQPPFAPIMNADEYKTRFNAAVTEYMGKLKERDVLTIRDYMDPALRARGRFTPTTQFEFFNQVSDRYPIIMLAHDFHWWDLEQIRLSPNPSPIRGDTLLYNIFDTRTEGFASAFEEMMLDAGIFDGHSRVRELVYAIAAERCAVAMGDLMMGSNDWTIDQGVKYASEMTPHGWLSTTSRNVWGADGEGLYLVQPTYGTSYTVGKIQIMQLLGDQARKLGDAFSLKKFVDDFSSAGLIPVTLIRWEMTGNADEIKRLTAPTNKTAPF
jgi:hypothetical protein